MKHSLERNSIRSIESFQTLFEKDHYVQNEYDIYTKGIMNEPTIEKLKEQKNSNKPLEIKTKTATIKIYMHPTEIFETTERLSEELAISGWGQAVNWAGGFSEYFSTKDLETKANKINNSVKIVNYISFGKKHDHSFDSICLTSYLWNEMVIKVVVKMAQVVKIERAASSEPGRKEKEYYLHLAYPPQYFLTKLVRE